MKIGRSKKRADLAVYTHNKHPRQENIIIIIEAKRDDKLPADDKDGDGQLMSYMAACSACRFGLWIGSERRAYENRIRVLWNVFLTYPDLGRIDPKDQHVLT